MEFTGHSRDRLYRSGLSASAPGAVSSAALVATDAVPPPAASLPCWCGSGEWQVCFRTRRFGLLRCSACGSFETDPPPLRGDDESARFYTDYYSRTATGSQAARPSAAKPARSAWFWKVVEHVPELARVRSSAVDIGSGDGHFCAELRTAGWPHVTGIEISLTRVIRARQTYPEIPFYSCAIGQTGIPRGSLDLIVMDSVIEHLPNPLEMVRELCAYLAPGGTLVVLTPNMESGHFRFLGRRWTGMLAPHAHIFLFNSAGLSRLLARCGLKISKCGSLHMPVYKPGEYIRRLISGDVKGTLWRAHQEIGGLCGRLIGAGPMLYAVATRE